MGSVGQGMAGGALFSHGGARAGGRWGSLPGLSSTDDIGLTFTVKDLDGSGSTNNIHITSSASPGQLIDGGNALKIQTDYGAVTLTALSSSRDGYGWGIVSAT